ncbi:MAG: hypothetical protein WA061_02675 [Microgenomates group bacterium]
MTEQGNTAGDPPLQYNGGTMWRCAYCNQYIPNGQYHSCYTQQPSPYPQTITYNSDGFILSQILDELKRIVEILEKIERHT